MPLTSGIQLAKEIRSSDKNAKIIFLSSTSAFVLDSYQVDAFYYILKPIKEEALFSQLTKAIQSIVEEQNKYIVVKKRNELIKVQFNEIQYAEIVAHTIYLYLRNGAMIKNFSTMLIRQILGLSFAVSLQYVLLGCEIKNKRTVYLVSVYSLFVMLVGAGTIVTQSYAYFMRIYPLMVNLPVLIGFVLLSKRKFFKVRFVELTVIALVVSITMAGIIISYFFDGNNTIVNRVSYVLYLPVWIVMYKAIRPSILYMLDSTEKGWLGFCMILLCYCVLVYSVSRYNLDAVVIGRIVRNVVLFFAMGFSAYYMIIKFTQARKQIAMQQ